MGNSSSSVENKNKSAPKLPPEKQSGLLGGTPVVHRQSQGKLGSGRLSLYDALNAGKEIFLDGAKTLLQRDVQVVRPGRSSTVKKNNESAQSPPPVKRLESLESTPEVQPRSQDERRNCQGYVVPSALEDTEKAIFRNGYWYNVSTLDVNADESTKTKSWIRSQVNAHRRSKHISYNIQGHTVPKEIHSIVTKERKKLDASQPKKDVLAVMYKGVWYTVVADHNKVKKIVRAGNKIETYIEKWVQAKYPNAAKASTKGEDIDERTARSQEGLSFDPNSVVDFMAVLERTDLDGSSAEGIKLEEVIGTLSAKVPVGGHSPAAVGRDFVETDAASGTGRRSKTMEEILLAELDEIEGELDEIEGDGDDSGEEVKRLEEVANRSLSGSLSNRLHGDALAEDLLGTKYTVGDEELAAVEKIDE